MFIHTVYFWLKPGTSEAQRDQLVHDCRRLLGDVDQVERLWTGLPANTPRDIVDNTYAVGLTILFRDREAQEIYQNHELHHRFIERNSPHWERVQVYDYVDGEVSD